MIYQNQTPLSQFLPPPPPRATGLDKIYLAAAGYDATGKQNTWGKISSWIPLLNVGANMTAQNTANQAGLKAVSNRIEADMDNRISKLQTGIGVAQGIAGAMSGDMNLAAQGIEGTLQGVGATIVAKDKFGNTINPYYQQFADGGTKKPALSAKQKISSDATSVAQTAINPFKGYDNYLPSVTVRADQNNNVLEATGAYIGGKYQERLKADPRYKTSPWSVGSPVDAVDPIINTPGYVLDNATGTQQNAFLKPSTIVDATTLGELAGAKTVSKVAKSTADALRDPLERAGTIRFIQNRYNSNPFTPFDVFNKKSFDEKLNTFIDRNRTVTRGVGFDRAVIDKNTNQLRRDEMIPDAKNSTDEQLADHFLSKIPNAVRWGAWDGSGRLYVSNSSGSSKSYTKGRGYTSKLKESLPAGSPSEQIRELASRGIRQDKPVLSVTQDQINNFRQQFINNSINSPERLGKDREQYKRVLDALNTISTNKKFSDKGLRDYFLNKGINQFITDPFVNQIVKDNNYDYVQTTTLGDYAHRVYVNPSKLTVVEKKFIEGDRSGSFNSGTSSGDLFVPFNSPLDKLKIPALVSAPAAALGGLAYWGATRKRTPEEEKELLRKRNLRLTNQQSTATAPMITPKTTPANKPSSYQSFADGGMKNRATFMEATTNNDQRIIPYKDSLELSRFMGIRPKSKIKSGKQVFAPLDSGQKAFTSVFDFVDTLKQPDKIIPLASDRTVNLSFSRPDLLSQLIPTDKPLYIDNPTIPTPAQTGRTFGNSQGMVIGEPMPSAAPASPTSSTANSLYSSPAPKAGYESFQDYNRRLFEDRKRQYKENPNLREFIPQKFKDGGMKGGMVNPAQFLYTPTDKTEDHYIVNKRTGIVEGEMRDGETIFSQRASQMIDQLIRQGKLNKLGKFVATERLAHKNPDGSYQLFQGGGTKQSTSFQESVKQRDALLAQIEALKAQRPNAVGPSRKDAIDQQVIRLNRQVNALNKQITAQSVSVVGPKGATKTVTNWLNSPAPKSKPANLTGLGLMSATDAALSGLVNPAAPTNQPATTSFLPKPDVTLPKVPPPGKATAPKPKPVAPPPTGRLLGDITSITPIAPTIGGKFNTLTVPSPATKMPPPAPDANYNPLNAGNIGDALRTITGAVMASKALPEYQTDPRWTRALGEAESNRNQGLSAAARNLFTQQAQDAQSLSVEAVRRSMAGGGAPGAVSGLLGNIAQTGQQAGLQLAVADQQQRQLNNDRYLTLLGQDMATNQALYNNAYNAALNAKQAGATLAQQGLQQINDRYQYWQNYEDPKSPYQRYLESMTKAQNDAAGNTNQLWLQLGKMMGGIQKFANGGTKIKAKNNETIAESTGTVRQRVDADQLSTDKNKYIQSIYANRTPIIRANFKTKEQSEANKQLYTKKVFDEYLNKMLSVADVTTDIMQAGNFIPHPIGQALGKIGGIIGTGVDAAQAFQSAYNGDNKEAIINGASAFLPSMIEKYGYMRNAKYINPNLRGTYYYPLNSRFGKMKPYQLLSNRVLASGLGSETIYDNDGLRKNFK